MNSLVHRRFEGMRQNKSGHRARWWLLALGAAISSMILPTPKAWAQG